jgi:LacI family transcriptional regulator
MKQPGPVRAARKPTIATVAAHAGVAVSTVSRYLNGHYVSKPVRARLSEVISSLGYSRSWTARNLSLGRKGSIGVVIDSSDDPWFVQLLTGIEEELSARDASLMLCSLELHHKYDPSIIFEWIRDRRIDGLVLAKSRRRERGLVKAATDAHLPIVTIAPDETMTHVQVVRCNNIDAGATLAEYLVRHGHTRIAFAGGPQHSIDSKHRLRGMQEGLARHGVRLDSRFVFSCGSWESDAGETFGRTLLAAPLDVTAVALANDALAFGFMRVAHQRGIRMPEDLSIVAFDGLPQGRLLYPSLTTMAQPMREMGRVACQRLFDSIEDPGRRENVEFAMHLIERESSGPACTRQARPELHLIPPPRP